MCRACFSARKNIGRNYVIDSDNSSCSKYTSPPESRRNPCLATHFIFHLRTGTGLVFLPVFLWASACWFPTNIFPATDTRSAGRVAQMSEKANAAVTNEDVPNENGSQFRKRFSPYRLERARQLRHKCTHRKGVVNNLPSSAKVAQASAADLCQLPAVDAGVKAYSSPRGSDRQTRGAG